MQFFRSAELSTPSTLPCNPDYHGLFRDVDGTIYLHHHIHSHDQEIDGIYLYRLVQK